MAPPLNAPRRADDIRRHNLGLVLAHVHQDGELTRAELTARLGMSRSTIGVLVADLAALDLVSAQVPTGGDRSGRPSHVVGPSETGPYAIAVDIDVQHACVAAVGIGGRILARLTVPFSADCSPQNLVAAIARAVPDLEQMVTSGAWPIGLGISIPGTVLPSGEVGFAPNLGWRNVQLAREVQAALAGQLRVMLGNDADLSVLAEHLRGAGRACNDLVYLLGRIGVGAGIIVGGEPMLGHAGRAGEIGHNVMDPAGPQCQCGKRGCVETYIGDSGLTRGVASASNSAEVLAAAAAGDPDAVAAVRSAAHWLGRVLANIVNVLDPERVILGGSFAGVLEFAREDVIDAVVSHAFEDVNPSELLTAPGLGDDSALLGAAELVFAGLMDDPLSVAHHAATAAM
jgi:predicted NBD/HSP70 family sugar kinase